MATPPRPKQRPKDLVQRYIDTINSLPEDELLFRTIVREAEGEGELGMALVAKAIFNRKKIIDSGTPVGKFKAKDETIKGILLGDGQFQPVTGDYRVAEDLTEEQRNNAIKAIELAKNNTMLKSKLEEENFSSDQIKNFLNVTGFRGLKAKEDKSQDVNKIIFKGHVFNTAGNKDLNIENLESFEGTTSREDGRKAVPLPMMKPEREDGREAIPFPMEKPIEDDTQKMLINEESPRKFRDIPPQIESPEDRTLVSDEEDMEDAPTGDSIFTEFFSMLGDVSDEDQVFEADELNLKEGGSVEEVDFVEEKSEKNDPPPGATPEEVADDIPAMLSEGEYVLPANVVKYIGLERIMDMHRGVLREIQQMEDLGMIQNVDENGKPEDDDKEMTFLEPEEGVMQETIIIAGKPKDGMMCPPGFNEGAAINRNVDVGDLRENIASERSPEGFTTTYDRDVGIINIKTPSGNITVDDTIVNYNKDPDQSTEGADPGAKNQGLEKEYETFEDFKNDFVQSMKDIFGMSDDDTVSDDEEAISVGYDPQTEVDPGFDEADEAKGGYGPGGSGPSEAPGEDDDPGMEDGELNKGGLMQRKGYANGGSVNYNIAGVGQVGGNLTQGAMNEMAEALPKPKTYDEIKGDVQGFEFPELNTASTDPDSENYYGRKLQGNLLTQRQEKADLVHRPDQGRDNAYNNDQELQVLLRRAGVDSEDFRFVMDEYKTGANDLLGQGPSTLNEQLKSGLDALTDKRRMIRDGVKAEDIPEGATNRDMLKKIFFNEIDDFGAELDRNNYQPNDKIIGIINQDPNNFNPNATEEYKAAIKSYDLDGPADPQKLGYAASMLDSDRGASAIPVKEDKGSGIMGERRYVEGVGYVKAA